MKMGGSCSFSAGSFVGMIMGILTFIGFIAAAVCFVRWFITGKICCCRVSQPISGEDDSPEAVAARAAAAGAAQQAAAEAEAQVQAQAEADRTAQTLAEAEFGGGNPVGCEFRRCPLPGVTIRRGPCGWLEFTQPQRQWRTCFIERPVETGVVRWTGKVGFGDTYAVGAACADTLDGCTASLLGVVPNSWSFCWDDKNTFGDDISSSGEVWGVMERDRCVEYRKRYGNNGLFSVEVDCDACVISFFLNKHKLPLAISGISLPVNMGVTTRFPDEGSAYVYLDAYCRLDAPTRSAEEVRLLRSRW